MKILIVQGSEPSSGGGVESFVDNLCKSNYMKDVNFTILYPTKELKFRKLDRSIDRINFNPIYIPFNDRRHFFKVLVLFFFNLKILLSRKNEFETFDVIHINGLAGSLLPIRFRKNCIFTAHGNSMDSFICQRKILKKQETMLHLINSLLSLFFEILAIRFSKIKVFVSPTVAKKFKNIGKGNAYIIPNGVELLHNPNNKEYNIREKYNLSAKSFICLWVGRNPERKGLSVAIRAIQDLNDVYLIVVGTDKKYLEANDQKVIYSGNVRSNELINLYTCSDILIFPSRYEAMSYTIIEALSMGLPVIGYRRNFMTEVVGNNYPLLCDTDEDFKKKIEYFLSLSTKDIIALKNECLNLAKRFDINIMASKYKKLYEEILIEKQ